MGSNKFKGIIQRFVQNYLSTILIFINKKPRMGTTKTESHSGVNCSVSTLPAEAGHVAGTDATEGQALWQPGGVCLFVGCLTSQQHTSVSQGRICTDNFTCCHTEIEAADQTFYLTQSQYTDTWPTSPSADPITPGAWQGRHRSANF